MKIVFPNPYGFPLPDQEQVLRFQQERGFSDDYRDFLLTQNGCSFRALSKDPKSEYFLLPGKEAAGDADLAMLYGFDTEAENPSDQPDYDTIFTPVFFPIGESYGGDLYVEILAGHLKGRIASLDHELHANSDTLEAFLAFIGLKDVDPTDRNSLADALCADELGLVWQHASSMKQFIDQYLHCDDNLRGQIVSASSPPAGLADLSTGIRRFAEIEHLLPRDCWAVTRNAANKGEFDDEPAVLHEGPLTLETLDLDDPLGDGNPVFLIFVSGDLTVGGAVFNDDTDGATGLIVEGNFKCRNAAVGGQEIYITGDLEVGELFWGEYNHGQLIVGGNATAQMFIASDGYDLVVRGEQRFVRYILDEKPGGESWRLEDADGLAEYVEPAFVSTDDDFVHLRRDEILAAWAQGRSVIRPAQQPDVSADIDRLFPDRTISPEAIRRIAAPDLLPVGGEDDAIGSVEFNIDDMICRIVWLQDERQEAERVLFFQRGEELAVSVGLYDTPDTMLGRLRAALRRLRGSPREQYLETKWKSIGPEAAWTKIDDRSPEVARDLLRKGWDAALGFAVARARVAHTITPQALRDLLALPVVEPYDDFYSDERNGFWAGSTYCAFRQEDAASEQSGLLRVTVEEDDTNLYFYEIVDMADGSEAVEIRFSPSLGSDDDSYPGYTGGAELDRAIRLFQIASRNLITANDDLLRGTFFSDDGFAMKHWGKKGYIKKRLP